jgi:hypothetical protein
MCTTEQKIPNFHLLLHLENPRIDLFWQSASNRPEFDTLNITLVTKLSVTKPGSVSPVALFKKS